MKDHSDHDAIDQVLTRRAVLAAPTISGQNKPFGPSKMSEVFSLKAKSALFVKARIPVPTLRDRQVSTDVAM